MNNQNLNNTNKVIPKSGQLLYEDKIELLLCKPHLIPLKSLTLQKLENMQKDIKREMSSNKNE